MERTLDRRGFLGRSAFWGGSFLVCSNLLDRSANAAPAKIDVQTVDELTVRQVTDGSHDIFLPRAQFSGLTVKREDPGGPEGKALQSEWGLALHLGSRRGQETKQYLLDFGSMPTTYQNNLALLDIDVSKIDALIISHGHSDHAGGLTGFLEAQRPLMRSDLRLYTGGEDDFCARFSRRTLSSAGPALDRRKLRAMNVEPVLSEAPIIIEGHAFTTGAVPRTSIEHVLPNTVVKFGIQDGLGCDPNAYTNHHFTAEELSGAVVPDQHWHEHATCFRLGDRGLVVITSCGHGGIINTLRRAQEVSGTEKIYALVGGFHLAPAPDDYLRQVMAELKKFDPEHVLPMHCSGTNFIELAKAEMPEKLVLCTTGSTFKFTA
jgi:7,8-dihydropterin-6-yl-methyl-4-(beta-D-ribofuranosyl)aminobenzene 5'-phosphate synthase